MANNNDIILKILNRLHPEVDFTASSSFIDEGLLDSFDMVTLVMELNEAFGVEIGVLEMVPENFSSLSTIQNLINSLKN